MKSRVGQPAAPIAFAPDGERIAVSAGDGTILLWKTPHAPGPAAEAPLPLAPKATVRVKDSDGAPLPLGAKMRFGTHRFQHGKQVEALRWSADGQSILVQTSSWDQDLTWTDLWVWDATAGKLLRQLEISAAFIGVFPKFYEGGSWEVSKDGKYLLTWKTIAGRKVNGLLPLQIREIQSGKVVFKDGLENRGRETQFTQDSHSLLDLSKMELITLATGKTQKLKMDEKLQGLGRAVFSPDGELLLLPGVENQPQILRLTKPEGIVQLGRQADKWVQPVFAPDSKQLAMVTEIKGPHSQELLLINSATGKVAKNLGNLDGIPKKLLFSPDGKQVAVVVNNDRKALDSTTVRHWDLLTGKELPAIDRNGNFDAVFSPDGLVLALGVGETVQLLDPATGREIRLIQLEVAVVVEEGKHVAEFFGECLAFSPDGKRIAVLVGSTVQQFDVATGKAFGPLPNSQMQFAISASSGGRWLAACTTGHVDVWDTKTSTVAFRLEPWLIGGKSKVVFTDILVSADGSLLAVAGSDGMICIYEVPTGKQRGQLRFHTAPVMSLACTSDAKMLVSADASGMTATWDIRTGTRLRSRAAPEMGGEGPWQVFAGGAVEPYIQDGEGTIRRRFEWPVLSANGQCLTITSKGSIRIFDLETGQRKTLTLEGWNWARPAVPTNGKILASADPSPASEECLVRLFDVGTGKEIRTLAAALPVFQCCFSPDHCWLAAGGRGGISIWRTATGTLMTTVHGHRGPVNRIAFSPDGGTLVSAGIDGTLMVWDVAQLLANSGK